jgi:hypothetical protein
MVVDAVNTCPELAVKFPEDHGKQREIACGFQKRSKLPQFLNCCGAIDGLLIGPNNLTLHLALKQNVDRFDSFVVVSTSME